MVNVFLSVLQDGAYWHLPSRDPSLAPAHCKNTELSSPLAWLCVGPPAEATTADDADLEPTAAAGAAIWEAVARTGGALKAGGRAPAELVEALKKTSSRSRLGSVGDGGKRGGHLGANRTNLTMAMRETAASVNRDKKPLPDFNVTRASGAAADTALRAAGAAPRAADTALRAADRAPRAADTAPRAADTALRAADTAPRAADTGEDKTAAATASKSVRLIKDIEQKVTYKTGSDSINSSSSNNCNSNINSRHSNSSSTVRPTADLKDLLKSFKKR